MVNIAFSTGDSSTRREITNVGSLTSRSRLMMTKQVTLPCSCHLPVTYPAASYSNSWATPRATTGPVSPATHL